MRPLNLVFIAHVGTALRFTGSRKLFRSRFRHNSTCVCFS